MTNPPDLMNLAFAAARHAAARQEVIAQNIANADTPGFRAGHPGNRRLQRVAIALHRMRREAEGTVEDVFQIARTGVRHRHDGNDGHGRKAGNTAQEALVRKLGHETAITLKCIAIF